VEDPAVLLTSDGSVIRSLVEPFFLRGAFAPLTLKFRRFSREIVAPEDLAFFSSRKVSRRKRFSSYPSVAMLALSSDERSTGDFAMMRG